MKNTKNILRIAVGFVLGAFTILGAQFFCSQFGCPIGGMKVAQSCDLASAPDISTLKLIPGTMHLLQNEVLFVASAKGVAAIRFTAFGDQHDDARYQWRFLPRDGSAESTGEGAVFEKYELIEQSPNNYLAKDLGSKTKVEAGPIKVSWSYNKRGAGWIICNPKLYASEITPDQQLADIDLKEKLASLPPPK